MKQVLQKSVAQPPANRRRVAADARKKASQQKKLVTAVILSLVMAALWLRFFIAKAKPKTALAVSDAAISVADAGQSVQEAAYIDLPMIAGRNDVLANDLFADRNFRGFKKIGEWTGSGMDTIDTNNVSEDLAAAAAQMELVAIVKDKKPQAFIEDNLVEPGQNFKFVFHGRTYNFKVISIFEDRVELECNGAVITKRIPDSLFTAE